MRTTVTLDSDTEALLRTAMRERGISFKQALNDAIRAGTAGRLPSSVSVPTFDLGQRADAGVNVGELLDKALHAAGALEDGELVRKLTLGK